MNAHIRKLAVLILVAPMATALSVNSPAVVGSLALVTAAATAVVASDTAEARRGGGRGGGRARGSRGHRGGHHRRIHRPSQLPSGIRRHHHDWDYGHRRYNHYGRWAAGAVVAGAVAGAVYYSAPCDRTVVRNGKRYYNCDGVYYRPRYSGDDVTYVVVNP